MENILSNLRKIADEKIGRCDSLYQEQVEWLNLSISQTKRKLPKYVHTPHL